MSMLKIANMRVPYPEMANYGSRGLPDNIAYIDQEEFDDLSVCEELISTELESDVGYGSARETPRKSPQKVRNPSSYLSCKDCLPGNPCH